MPPVAVGEDRQGRFVWVVRDAEEGLATVHRTAVTVGELGRRRDWRSSRG